MSSSATPTAGPTPSSKKISSACTACQNRKSKCTGGVPCDKCRLRGTNCVFDQAADGRTKVALKRKQQDLEDDRDLLLQLVETIRDSDDRNITQLVNVIRSNASLQEIKICMDNSVDKAEQSGAKDPGVRVVEDAPEGSQLEPHGQIQGGGGGGGGGVTRRRVMDMNRLVDIPIISVPAAPWTNVTKDAHLVSHLVSLWFTWSAPWQNWIVRSLFVKDMQSENLDAQFCSPFLVNAMLAHACPYSDYPEAKTTAGGMSELMEHLLVEAKRLLDQEAGRARLATVQGLGILYHCVSSMGKDRLGWFYMRQLVEMLNDLDMAVATDASLVPGGGVDVMSDAMNYTCWGLWIATTTSCFTWHKPPIMEQPGRPRPQIVAHNTEADAWIPYPEDQTAVPGHALCLSNTLIDLMAIVHETAAFLFTKGNLPTIFAFRTRISELCQTLDSWYRKLPPCLSVSHKTPFQVMYPHFYYYHLSIVLYAYLDDLNINSPIALEVPAGSASLRAHGLCARSAVATARLLQLHRAGYGISRICDSTMLWTAAALFALLEEDLRVEPHKSAFVDLCISARSYSRRWILGKGILRSVQLTAKRKQRRVQHPILPFETEKLFEDFENYIWTTNTPYGTSHSVREEFSSFYPILTESVKKTRQKLLPKYATQKPVISNDQLRSRPQAYVEESPPVIEMDQFLEMYDSLLISKVSQADSVTSVADVQPTPQPQSRGEQYFTSL